MSISWTKWTPPKKKRSPFAPPQTYQNLVVDRYLKNLCHFRFWVGHANFNLTESMCMAIERVRGVDTLDILTRYRFVMSVGEQFDEEQTKSLVELSVKYPSRAIGLENISRELDATHSCWVIGEMPNGSFETVGAESIERAEFKAEEIKSRAKRLIYSWR